MSYDLGGLEPFKGRKLYLNAAVRVYRNLNRPGVWYSIMQQGRVVAHARSISLYGCSFHVNLAGARRAARQGRRNVHAFVIGLPTVGPARVQEVDRARYNAKLGRFEIECDGGSQKVISANYVWLGSFGMLVSGSIVEQPWA